MTLLDDIYSRIAEVLEAENQSIAAEFRDRRARQPPMEIFLWLHGLSEDGRLSAATESLLTDLLFAIR
jgi:hypothetical protein